MAEEQEEPLTLTQHQLAEFIDALKATLVDAVVETNKEAMHSLLETTFPPLMERLEMIAMAQATLAAALRTNRRDSFALEFARILVERALRAPEGLDAVSFHTIPATAYALADEMDVHGRVAEVQAKGKEEQIDSALKNKPRHVSSQDFVDNFFGRKSNVERPKVETKKGAGAKKH